ncbi:MAG: GntR family transcriptional regulator [Thermoguttaceae bacterium]
MRALPSPWVTNQPSSHALKGRHNLAAHAAVRRLEGRCDPLRREVQAIVNAARRRDFNAFQHHNQVFHRAIFEASGSGVLLRIWDSLAFEVRTHAILEYLKTIDPVAVAKEHEAIVDAIENGDAKRAAKLLQSHSRGLVRYLKRKHSQTDAAGSMENLP